MKPSCQIFNAIRNEKVGIINKLIETIDDEGMKVRE